jgi:hypothetical protein
LFTPEDLWEPIMVILFIIDIQVGFRMLAKRQAAFGYIVIVIVVECCGADVLVLLRKPT